MRVQQILKGKGSSGVETVPPGTKIRDVIATLAGKGIGALVVSGDGAGIDGILSERDIVRELAKRGAECLSENVDAFMTRDPVTVTLTAESDEVFRTMTEGRFRHLPVVDGGKMVGLISIGDVVKARLAELSMEKDALQGMIMGH